MNNLTRKEPARTTNQAGLVSFIGHLGKFALIGLLVALLLGFVFGWLSLIVLNNTWAGQERDFQFWLHNFTSLPLDLLFGFATTVGGIEGTLVMAAILFLILLYKRQFGWAALVFITEGGGILLNTIFKDFFHRARPELWESSPGINRPLSYSFPSGHATMSMCFFGLLIYLGFHFFQRPLWRWWWAVLMLVLIMLVGLSRIYFGVHYPTDVLGGYILGGFWLLSLIGGTNLHLSQKKQITTAAISPDRPGG